MCLSRRNAFYIVKKYPQAPSHQLKIQPTSLLPEVAGPGNRRTDEDVPKVVANHRHQRV